MPSTDPKTFLTPDEARQVETAIARAESNTSAEIKLVIARHCWGSIRDKARSVFRSFGLEGTAGRNCVLILVITTNREFLIYGDRAVHEKVGQSFWDDVRDEMLSRFRESRFGDGMALAATRVGEKLSGWFPHQADDVDEIPNEVGYED